MDSVFRESDILMVDSWSLTMRSMMIVVEMGLNHVFYSIRFGQWNCLIYSIATGLILGVCRESNDSFYLIVYYSVAIFIYGKQHKK
jgi:hypothetical protein